MSIYDDLPISTKKKAMDNYYHLLQIFFNTIGKTIQIFNKQII